MQINSFSQSFHEAVGHKLQSEGMSVALSQSPSWNPVPFAATTSRQIHTFYHRVPILCSPSAAGLSLVYGPRHLCSKAGINTQLEFLRRDPRSAPVVALIDGRDLRLFPTELFQADAGGRKKQPQEKGMLGILVCRRIQAARLHGRRRIGFLSPFLFHHFLLSSYQDKHEHFFKLRLMFL